MTCTPRGLTLGASKIILIIPSVSPMIWPRPWLPYLSLPTTEQARVAVCHAFGFEYKKETDRFRPTYLFSIPEAAWVGLNGGAGAQISIHLCEASTDDCVMLASSRGGRISGGVRIAQVYLLGSSLQANKYDVTPFPSK